MTTRPQRLTPAILHALKYFDAAARHLSFTKAADELCVTQGAISQQIRGLEDQIGVKLFQRLAKGIALSYEGERLYKVVKQILAELETEMQAIQPQSPDRHLIIRSSPSFCMMWLMPRLSRFSRLYPNLEIRLKGEMFGMPVAKMNAEAIDALIVYGRLAPEDGLDTVLLMSEFLLPVASPAYIEIARPIRELTDFVDHTLLHDDSPWEGAPPYAEWEEWVRGVAEGRRGKVEKLGKRGNLYNLAQLATNAALLGQGVSIARTSLILDELEKGQLVPVYPVCVKSASTYFLVLNPGTAGRESIETFKGWLQEECHEFEKRRNSILAAIARVNP